MPLPAPTMNEPPAEPAAPKPTSTTREAQPAAPRQENLAAPRIVRIMHAFRNISLSSEETTTLLDICSVDARETPSISPNLLRAMGQFGRLYVLQFDPKLQPRASREYANPDLYRATHALVRYMFGSSQTGVAPRPFTAALAVINSARARAGQRPFSSEEAYAQFIQNLETLITRQRL